jgi:shikimate kinase
MKIFLIGMPGSGKTTLGKEIADELHLPFVDLDDEIVKKDGRSITEIFSASGENYFRQTESTTLLEWASSSRDFVMATGGGAPCFHMGIDVINKTGVSVFLDVPISTLLDRLKSKTDRPLLSDDLTEKEQKLRSLRDIRLVCYSKAKIKLTNPDIHEVLKAIRLK